MHIFHLSNSFIEVHAYVICLLFGSCLADGYLRYDEIVSLGASCAPDDSCSVARDKFHDHLGAKTCQCKSSCVKHGTCCINSPSIALEGCNSHLYDYGYQKESCINLLGTNSFIFAVNTCRYDKFIDAEIRNLCENSASNFQDPLAVLPVTSMSSSITYKNYFCALCNDAAESTDLVFWKIEIRKALSPFDQFLDTDKFVQQLIYDEITGQWGIGTTDNDRKRLESVSLSFDYYDLQDKVNPCVPDLISDCHPAWKTSLVKYKCQRYMGMVYARLSSSSDTLGSSKRFKNIHCAICNFANYTDQDLCRDIFRSVGAPPLSFSLLLDINLKDGNKVGQVRKCTGKEVYDPFFKKCRELVCVKSDYKIVNGKCVPP